MAPRWWLGFLVSLAPVAPLMSSAFDFFRAGVWTPVYGIHYPPVWLYDMATIIGTI